MLPFWVILFLIVVVGSIFLGLLIFAIVRRSVHHDVLKKHHDLAGFIIGTLGVLYSVFLGFTIVHSQDRYVQITSQVSREAYLCADLFRIAAMFPKEKIEIQNAVSDYLKSVIQNEWCLMPYKEESPITLVALERLWEPFYNFKPNSESDKIWFSRALSILFDFNSARLARIYSSWYSLGSLSWLALIAGALVLITLLFFFGTENNKAQMALNSFFIGYIALMIFTVYSLENPFAPPEEIKPRAYEIVYNYYNMDSKGKKSPESEELIPTNKY